MRRAAALAERDRAPRRDPAAGPAPAGLLALQRAAGNQAVALFVQRVLYQRVDRDEVAEQERFGSNRATHDVDIAVAYVAEAGSQQAVARPPQWSDAQGSADASRHAERLALAEAKAAGYPYYRQPHLDDRVRRVVAVFTELYPCWQCAQWLDDNAWFQLPVRWTAPHGSQSNARADRAKKLWQSRNVALEKLAKLRSGVWYLSDEAGFGRKVEALWDEIVSVPLTATSQPTATPETALALDKQWRDRADALVAEAAEGGRALVSGW